MEPLILKCARTERWGLTRALRLQQLQAHTAAQQSNAMFSALSGNITGDVDARQDVVGTLLCYYPLMPTRAALQVLALVEPDPQPSARGGCVFTLSQQQQLDR